MWSPQFALHCQHRYDQIGKSRWNSRAPNAAAHESGTKKLVSAYLEISSQHPSQNRQSDVPASQIGMRKDLHRRVLQFVQHVEGPIPHLRLRISRARANSACFILDPEVSTSFASRLSGPHVLGCFAVSVGFDEVVENIESSNLREGQSHQRACSCRKFSSGLPSLWILRTPAILLKSLAS